MASPERGEARGQRLAAGFRVRRIESRHRAVPAMLRPKVAVPLLVAVLRQGDEPTMLDGRVVPAGTVVLIAHDTPTILAPGAGGRLIVVAIPRSRLQAAASARLGTPRRLGMSETWLDRSARTAALEGVLMGMEDGAAGRSAELLERLIDCLADEADCATTFPIARSVKAATDHVQHHIEEDCRPERLAAVAGVTTAWLRQNFRACLGVSITGYVQGVRLDLARDRLLSGLESRSIAAIAFACGFQTANAFSRAYALRFGEAPSATRARVAHRLS